MNEFAYKMEELKQLKWALRRIFEKKSGKAQHADLNYVKKTYEYIWSQKHGNSELGYTITGRINGRCAEIRQADVRKKRVADLSAEVNAIKANSVMELGSGYGINLLSLALLCPSLKKIKGVELSEEGVKQFHHSLENLPLDYLCYLTGQSEPQIVERIKQVDFDVVQGNMFEYRSPEKYDLVFTNAAIEQTGLDYPMALETARLHAKKRCVFVEQFQEAQNPLQHLILVAKDYFRAPYSCIEEAGMTILRAEKWPLEKLVHSWGIVVAEVTED